MNFLIYKIVKNARGCIKWWNQIHCVNHYQIKRTALLKRLTAVEGFEQFLHKTFVGQKRFSIEGVDMLVPVLDEIVLEGAKTA